MVSFTKQQSSAESTNSAPHVSKSEQESSFLRVLLLLTITLTGLVAAGLCYYFIRNYQTLFYESQFFGMISDHFKSTKKSFGLLLQANVAVATALATACPSASQWPNCSIPSLEFSSRTSPLSSMSGVLIFAVTPIVRPEKRKSFEAFAADYYSKDGGYPPGTGSIGIYHLDGVTPVRSPNHTDPSLHRRDIFVPFLYTSVPFTYLADAYNDPTLGPTLDEILDCVDDNTHESCSTTTTFIPSSPFSGIGTPIKPINDPDTVVGFAGATFAWETLFSTAVQHDFNFQCSIKSESSSLVKTFTITNGVARETTAISHPSPSFDGFWKQSSRSFVLNPDGILVTKSKYTITYYSSDTAPSPKFAVIAGLCSLGITFLISMIFVVFNTLISQAALEASMLLDSKRTYVRFVSHEIRSALPPPPPSSLLFSPSLTLAVYFTELLSTPSLSVFGSSWRI
jgi:hypothetical protein